MKCIITYTKSTASADFYSVYAKLLSLEGVSLGRFLIPSRSPGQTQSFGEAKGSLICV